MDAVARLAEARIREAIEQGAFDDLPGRGRPLVLDDLRGVPDELRVATLMLKRAGVLPEELELRREIATIGGLLDACVDALEAKELRARRSWQQIRYDVLMEKRRRSCATIAYRGKIVGRFGRFGR